MPGLSGVVCNGWEKKLVGDIRSFHGCPGSPAAVDLLFRFFRKKMFS
jgi:hypothetical protein